MFNRLQLKQVFRQLLVILGVLLLSRITKNWGFIFVSLYGVACCIDRKIGQAFVIFLLISFLPMVNPFIMPRYGQFAMIARISSMLMSLALLASGVSRQGPHRLPLDLLFVYLFIAAFTSLQGYAPLISELKVVNFLFLLLAISVGTRNLHKSPGDILFMRNAFLAIIAFTVYGSLLTLPFPHIAYLTSLRSAMANHGLDYAYEAVAVNNRLLFSGATAHSQFLGPMSACCLGWLLCDTWLVERRWNPLHVALMLPIPIIAYLTRSRIALLTLVVTVLSSVFLFLPQTNLTKKAKTRFYCAVFITLFALLTTAIVSEFQNHTVSRWIRKTDDVTSDDRTLGNALTQSRQGTIAQNLRDFRRNRLFGSGFQVSQKMAGNKSSSSSLFSAPIEKGLLPLMVLGESGILGSTVFVIFLISFFSVCKVKRYLATATLFIVFLTTNMAEATFFSPAGAGGVFWSLLVIGGFTIDMAVVARRQSEQEMLYYSFQDSTESSDGDDEELPAPADSEPIEEMDIDVNV